jgi:2-methylcitrate dehydratase PrpD
MSGQSPRSAADAAPPATATRRLAARLARPVGAADRRRAALHLLDWAGTAVAGARHPVSAALARFAPEMGAQGELFFWGGLGNILEMDDVDKRALLHPGPVVVPAALLAAERAGADASALLDAIVRGYEAMIRVGRAVGPAHYAFWHNTATCGPFGAAAAAASLFHLGTEETSAALGLAGTQSAGLWQMRHEPLSNAKQLHAARAAHSGYAAARLVGEGFAGLHEILEGPQGLFAATCGGADPEAVADVAAGAPSAIHEVSFKPWPACRHAHAAIDAALNLLEAGVGAGEVDAGVIAVYADAVRFCDNPAPGDPLSARFSLQHAVAATLLGGPPALDAFEGEGLRRADIAALRSRLRVVEDAELTARYPARFGARLTLVLKSGAEIAVEIPDALGDPENPLDARQIENKAAKLIWSAGRDPGPLVAAAQALADGAPRAPFMSALRRALAS